MDGYAQRLIYPLISLDYYQALIYVVVFSITGVLAVGRKDVDLFGVVMLGLITALGGGTIRDVLLNIRVFWVQDFNYVWAGAMAAVVAFFGVRNFGLQAVYRPRCTSMPWASPYSACSDHRPGTDHEERSPGGGAIGDDSGHRRRPGAGRPGRQADADDGSGDYATPLLLGGILYVVLLKWFQHFPSSLMAVVFMIGFRWAAIRWDLTYPWFLRLGSELRPDGKHNYPPGGGTHGA